MFTRRSFSEGGPRPVGPRNGTNTNKKSFTLIEIIIVITIIVLFSGLSIASYNNYTEQQKLETDTKKIVDVLELVRKKASANDASLCSGEIFDINRVVNYTFSTPNTSSFKFAPVCQTGQTATPVTYTTKSYNLFINIDKSVDFLPNNQYIFKSGATILSDYCLILKNSIINSCRFINISTSGVISNGKSTDCASCL